MTDHMPVRPAWGCSCGNAEWPDEEARASLLEEFAGSRPSLGVYLVGCWYAAMLDLPDEDVGDLYQRMVGWHRG